MLSYTTLSVSIALSIFSNVYSLLINTLCWSFVDDMNSLFAFQTKYAKQNVVLKILSVSTFMMFKQQKTTMSKICSI
jgi:hypothetical protein